MGEPRIETTESDPLDDTIRCAIELEEVRLGRKLTPIESQRLSNSILNVETE